MIPVSSAATVRARDHAVIHTLGVPSHTLMELAGHGAAQHIHAALPAGAAAAVFCGPGNNGGDGYVVARWLKTWGRPVCTWAAAPPRTPDAQTNAQLCARLGIPTAASPAAALAGAGAAVDALLGTGQRAAPRGSIAAGVAALADAAVPVFALDVPTGLCADTGQPLGDTVVTAAATVTFGDWKQGLLCEPAATLAGPVHRVDIGLDLAAPLGAPAPEAGVLTTADIRLPRRGNQDAKWSRGHVAIRAGGGAAVLAAHGAFRAGAGLVTLLAPRSEWPRLVGLWPVVILAEPDALDPRRHDVLVIGPGLGVSDDTEVEVRALWQNWSGGLVADADALTLLARMPPPASRLLDTDRRAVEADRFAAAGTLQDWGVVVLKGPNTIVAAPNEPHAVVPVRCGRLATAGSGDVLAGLVGGLLAQGAGPRDAAIGGAWWHAAAGEAMPPRGTAMDLLDALAETATV